MSKEIIITGKWTIDSLNQLLNKSASIDSPSHRIAFISENFLGIPYREDTLIGNIDTPEEFVINLEAVDCFTFLEYVESMRLSNSFDEFKEKLKCIRYQNKEIKYSKRNHFFTDWVHYNSAFVKDVTYLIGGDKAILVEKKLNLKEDGTTFLRGVNPISRKVTYLPYNSINDDLIDEIKTGDYIGIYSDKLWLDVSHVGIFIKKGEKVLLRHASSKKNHGEVIDQDFKDYIKGKLGLIIIRAY